MVVQGQNIEYTLNTPGPVHTFLLGIMSQDLHQSLLVPRPEDSSFLKWTGHIPIGTASAPHHQIIGYGPRMGHEGDLLRVTMVLLDMNLLPHLSIAIGSWVAPTTGRAVIERTLAISSAVELTAPVPNPEWMEEKGRKRVPVCVVVCDQGQQHHQVQLDYWFVGHFAFESATTPRSLRAIPPLLASTDSDSRGLALLPGRAKRTRAGGPHSYLITYDGGGGGGKPGSASMIPSIGVSQDHITGATEEEATKAGQSAPSRYDEQEPTTATEVMAHPPFHNISGEDDESQYLDTPITMATSAAVSYSPTIAGMDLYPSNRNGFGAEEDEDGVSSSSSLYSYVVPAPGAMQAAATHLAGLGTIATARPRGGRERQLLLRSVNYSDYDRLPYRANLRFESDLNVMTQNWTFLEMQQHRRLVRFWRQQQPQHSNDDILCSFAPIYQDEQPDQTTMTVVSCIYWREAEDYFITSVDCIYLLENLLGAYFTAEEKNRVRRNFEAFRPQTISRLRPESAAFFRLVMDFPPPKPRTIEKDLKVFPWSCLASALQKVVGKYQPSYSSTASINLSGLAATSSVRDPPYSQSFD